MEFWTTFTKSISMGNIDRININFIAVKIDLMNEPEYTARALPISVVTTQ